MAGRPGFTRRLVMLTLGTMSMVLLASGIIFSAPDWWSIPGRSVLDPVQNQDNRAAVTVGQLKSIALRAQQAMNAQYSGYGGAGTEIATMIDGWVTHAATDEQNAAATVGQVKTVAKLFYDRLDDLGVRSLAEHGYPWNNLVPAENAALATAGQLKTVFSFELEAVELIVLKHAGSNTGSTEVAEGAPGTSDSYTVALRNEPPAGVSVTVAIDAENDQTTVAPASLTFNSTNWNTPQTVTVNAVNDAIVEGGHEDSLVHLSSSTDPEFDGLMNSLSVDISDDDTGSIVVTETGGATEVTEGGASDSYEIKLGAEPAGDVTVTLNGGAEVVLSESGAPVSFLVFTPGNWNVARTITVTAEDDSLHEVSPKSIVISHAATSGGYHGVSGPNITANVHDNEVLTLSVASTLPVTEGGTANLVVKLNMQPASGYTVTVNPVLAEEGDADLSLGSLPSLILNGTNWNTGITIPILAAEDDEDVITGRRVLHLDAEGAPDVDVELVEVDDDLSLVADSQMTVVEGETSIFKVRLNTRPVSPVTISAAFASSGDADLTLVNGPAFELDQLNWSDGVDIQIAAAADTDHTAGSRQLNITNTIGAPISAMVHEADDDVPAVLLVESDGQTVVAEGGVMGHYLVRLMTQPSDPVTVAVSGGGGQVTFGPPTVTFTAENWNQLQKIMVYAMDDAVVEASPHTAVLVHEATSEDADYDGITVGSVTVNVIDDDTAPPDADNDGDGIPDAWELAHAGEFAVWPEALGAQLKAGESSQQPIRLNNDTGAAVSYSIAVTGTTYSQHDSRAGSVPHTWQDISSTGTRLEEISEAGFGSQAVPVTGFTFPFYGENHSEVHVNAKGFVAFEAGIGDQFGQPLPGAIVSNAIIAPFWSDLKADLSGDIYVKEESDRLIIQYQNVATGYGPGTYTFQVVLFASGQIEFRYHTLAGPMNYYSAGIQNAGGENGLQIALNNGFLAGSMTVSVQPRTGFFTTSLTSGSVAAHSVTTLNGLFSTLNLPPGTHSAVMTVTQNGAGEAVQSRPVTLSIPLPRLSIISPSPAVRGLMGQPVELRASIGGLEGVTRVRFYAGSTEVASSISFLNGEVSNYYWAPASSGYHTLTARAFGAGNQLLEESLPTYYLVDADTDNDGIGDFYEVENGLTVGGADGDDSLEDKDGDRIPNIFEFKNGTRADDPMSKPDARYIVDPAHGDDSSIDNVVATIGQVTGIHSRPYDIIEVRSGIYQENVAVFSPVLMIAELGGTSGPVEIRGGEQNRSTLELVSASVLDGFILTHNLRAGGAGIRSDAEYTDGSKRRRLVNCVIRGNTSGGGVANIEAKLDLVHCTITGNTLAGSGGHAISNSSTGKVRLINSIVWGNGPAASLQIYNASGSTTEIIQSVVEGGSPPLNTDPSLTQAGWLKSSSVAINYPGVTLMEASRLDIHGEPRDADGTPDLGADEYVDDNGTFDSDGLPDWAEVSGDGSADDDGDDDGLTALQEYNGNTSPLLADTDGDGANDGLEVSHSSDPLIADTDADGILDGYEIENGLAVHLDDTLEDSDGDRVPNIFEFKHETAADDPLDRSLPDFIVDPVLGAASTTDNVYPTVENLLNREIPPFSIIEFKAGRYEDELKLPSVPLLVLGQLGCAPGPVELRSLRYSDSGATLTLSPLTVIDGFVLTCWPGYQGVAVRTNAYSHSSLNGSTRCRMVNCVIRGYAARRGPAIDNLRSFLDVVHCTITGNSSATSGSAIYNGSDAKITLINSIVWGNGVSGSLQIFNASGGTLAITHTLVEGGGTSLDTNPSLTPAGWLNPASTAINHAGVTLTAASAQDIHGDFRNGGGIPDLGADEYVDSNSDGLPDWLAAATDGDGLTALVEYSTHGTNPFLTDTDGDGRSDSYEIAYSPSALNPLNPDHDGDGFSDGVDGNPLVNSLDPLADSDGDGMTDGYEVDNGLNPILNDAASDNDLDGLTNLQEFTINSQAYNDDTDGDGLSDGFEHKYGFNVLLAVEDVESNSDNDRLTLLQESDNETNPTDEDSDDDGYLDGHEVEVGSDPNDIASKPFDPKQFYGPEVDEIYEPIGDLGTTLPGWGNRYSIAGWFGQAYSETEGSSRPTKWKLTIGGRPRQNSRKDLFKSFKVALSPNQVSEITMDFLGYASDKNSSGEKASPPAFGFHLYENAPEYAEGPYNGFIYVDPSFAYPGSLSTTEDEGHKDLDWKGYLIPYLSTSYSRSYSGADAAGPRYRKISLAGRPIPDQLPEQEEETETHGEQTYVDAYDLTLHHDTTYVHVPLAASDLVLEAKASVRSAHWTDRGGLRPHEELTSPFGVGWSSNLCSYIEIVQTGGNGSDDPVSVNVVDEGGQSQRFGTQNMVSFFPWPSSRVDKKTYLNTLEWGVGGSLVLKKKYGHTLVYARTDGSFTYSSDRLEGSDSVVYHKYWRLVSVTDRYGNQLLYEYGDGNVSLIPQKIHTPNVNGVHQWIAINRSVNCRLINSITDSRGETVKFEYSHLLLDGYPYATLNKVSHPDGTTTQYGYTPAIDPEDVMRTRTKHYHVDLSSITDGGGGTHQFTYGFDRTKFYNSSSSSTYVFAASLSGVPQTVRDHAQRRLDEMNEGVAAYNGSRNIYGLPRPIAGVFMPDQTRALFQKTQDTELHFSSTFSGKSGTVVLDAENHRTFYVFDGLHGEIVDVDNQTSSGSGSVSNSSSIEWMLYYQSMHIFYEAEFGTYKMLGSESFEFDLTSGLSLKKMKDMSGNETVWEYGDGLGAATGWQGMRMPFKNQSSPVMTVWADPTKKTDALGRTETYSYSINHRVMNESVDVHGTKTETEVDELGRRKCMIVTGPDDAVLKRETYLYDDEDTGAISGTLFPGFMVEKKVKAFANPSGQAWEQDIVTHYEPDGFRRIAKEIVDPGAGNLALTTRYTYDLNNNKLSVTNPLNQTTFFSYDDRNRLIKITHPVAGTSQGNRAASARYVYNQRGNRAVIVDEEGRYTIHHHDALGRLTKTVKDMDGAGLPVLPLSGAPQWLASNKLGSTGGVDLVTLFEYNNVNSAIKQTDPKGNVTRTFYDALQRPVHVYGNFANNDADENGVEKGTAVRTSTEKTHTEYDYDLDKNSGASGLEPKGFKPTTVIRHHVVRSNSDALKTLTDHYEYDGVYREIDRKTQFNPDVTTLGGQAVTETVYGDGSLDEGKEDLRIMVTDPLEKKTQTILDGLGRKVQTIDAFDTSLASTTSQLYSSTGLAFKSTDPLGRITETEFDAAGRATKVWQPDPVTGAINRQAQDDLLTGSLLTVTCYDKAGNVKATINPRGHRTDFEYDARNRKVKEWGPEVHDASLAPGQPAVRPVSQVTYNGVGKVISTIDPRFATTVTQYDRADRPTHSLTPAVAVHGLTGLHILTTVTEYDKNGNVTRVTDAAGNRTVNFYDNLNRLTTTATNPVTGQPSTTFGSPAADDMRVTNEYDDAGNKTLITDGNGAQTAFRYDGQARNTKIIWDPGKNKAEARNTTFNALVQTSRTDEEGNTTNYLYDDLHRQKDIQYAGRSIDNRRTTYDLVGNVLDVTYPNDVGSVREVHQTFDKLNRLVTESSAGVTHAYQYDKAGNRRVTTYGQTGRQLLSTYDAYNRLLTCTEAARVTEYGYDLTGNIARHLLPNGVKVSRTFDLLNRQTSATHLVTGDTDPFSINTYSYDKSGNNRQIQEDYPAGNLSSRTVLNTYDKVYRLNTETQTTTGSGTVTTVYGYDKGNNRTSMSVTGGSTPGLTTYVYGSGTTASNANSNQLVTLTRPDASAVTYTYDKRGNRKTRTAGGHTDTYDYDRENRLISLDYETGSADTGLYSYDYDHRTRRVVRDESAVSGRALTLLSFSGGTSVQEHTTTVSATPAVEYLRGSDYGGGIGGILYTLKAGAATFNHYNSRGDVIARTDGSGDLAYQAQYEAYGKRTAESGTNTDRQTANTKDEDPTGLLNEGFRYRDLETGSFITRDPGGFVDGPNLYTYVQQNPWSKSDPEGLFWSALLTVASAAYDTYQYANGNMSGADYARSMIVNGAALAADVVTGGQGGGMLVRAAALSCKAKSAIVAGAKMIEKADNIISTVESAAGAMESISEGNYGAAAMQVGSALMTGKASASKIDTPSFCFAAGTGVWQGDGTVSIETLRVGQRIIADPGEGSAPTATLTGDWLEVEMTFEDPFGWGRLCRATLLRPADYVAAKEWREGAQVPMHFGEEVAARDGLATVVRVTKVSQVEAGPGRVVTATFQTWNADLRELWMEGLDKPVLVTGGHRFYSETRGEWVRVHDFLLGEKIRSLDGGGRSVLEVRQVPGVHAVFNMEVEGLHQYHVSEAGLLAHNTTSTGNGCGTANEIQTSNNAVIAEATDASSITPISGGTGRAPKDGADPNSIYVQKTNDGQTKSVSYYDENGKQFSHEDYIQKADHKVMIDGKKVNLKNVPHEHQTRTIEGPKGPYQKNQVRTLDQNGKPTSNWVNEH